MYIEQVPTKDTVYDFFPSGLTARLKLENHLSVQFGRPWSNLKFVTWEMRENCVQWNAVRVMRYRRVFLRVNAAESVSYAKNRYQSAMCNSDGFKTKKFI